MSDDDRKLLLQLAGYLVFFLSLVVADLGWNQYVYGDWRCAWADCRINISR